MAARSSERSRRGCHHRPVGKSSGSPLMVTRTCQAGAARLLEDLRDLTEEPLSIDVLGPLRLHSGGVESSSPELRRSRVRTVLAMLVVRGPAASRASPATCSGPTSSGAWPPRTSASPSAGCDGCSNQTAPPANRRRGFGATSTRSSWPDHHSSTPTFGGSNGTLPRRITRSRPATRPRRSHASHEQSTYGAAIHSSISPRSTS